MPTIRERFARLFQADPQPADPKTYDSTSGGKEPTYFGKRGDDLPKLRRIYQQGGLVSEGVDCYPLFILSNGYRLEGQDESLTGMVQEFLDSTDFDAAMWRLIVDAFVVKKGLAEIVLSRDGTKITQLLPRPAEEFVELKDDFGKIVGYRQEVMRGLTKTVVDLKPEQMFRLDLGYYIIARSMDDIERDVQIADGSAKFIMRHGFPRWHIKLGQPGETVKKEDMTKIESQFQDLKPQHDMATSQDVDIINIDQSGSTNIKVYGEWSIDRLCATLGVPNELLGLGRGSTEATANVRLQAFYNKIGTLQKRVARAVNLQIIDRITGQPGKVKLVFNDVSPVDESMRADVVTKLVSASGIDPWAIVTPQWCRDFLGIKVEETEEGDSSERESRPAVPTPEQLNAQIQTERVK